jgi:hypothetical protein
MMRMTKGWTGLRTAVIALGLLTWSAPSAQAALITSNPTSTNELDYSTAGAINSDSTNTTGPNVISYIPVQNAQSNPTSNVQLGYFEVAAPTSGQTTSYNNTPFSITVLPNSLGGISLGNSDAITINGTLNGTVSGPSQSSVQATFSPIANGSFLLNGASSTLSMMSNMQLPLVPSTTGVTPITPTGGITGVNGTIVTTGNPETPAPEPSTIALFLSTVGGLGLRRYVQARRQRAQTA